jgi:hypothetical protein
MKYGDSWEDEKRYGVIHNKTPISNIRLKKDQFSDILPTGGKVAQIYHKPG